MRNGGTWTKLSWDDGAKKLTIAVAPLAGVTNESTTPREFKVEMLPAGTVKTVSYNGHQAEVTLGISGQGFILSPGRILPGIASFALVLDHPTILAR